MTELSCEKMAACIRTWAAWHFADLIRYHFGEKGITLTGEGLDGQDITLAITRSWLKENQIKFSDEQVAKFVQHARGCDNLQCAEAISRLEQIEILMDNGLPYDIIEKRLFSLRRKRSFSRSEGYDKSIDMLMPFFLWFLDREEHDLWKWPEK